MNDVRRDHFSRAATDIAAHGDNDTLPFDVDNRFVKENAEALVDIAYAYNQGLRSQGAKAAAKSIDALDIFSERLLSPVGAAGFRIVTKIHPFWSIYFNGLGIAIAEALEPTRNSRAHSYRFSREGTSLFDRTASWRAYRAATISDCETNTEAVVVQTDISGFYGHVYHHRLENCINDLFPTEPTVAAQIDRFLNSFASGRSFGLPVGGQCSRVLGEVLLSQVDRQLQVNNISWRRYVDDFVLIAADHAEAYKALAVLAHALADYGLTLNRTKTTILNAKHYIDYARTQLGGSEEESSKLMQIDLYFDPYSDTPESDFDELKEVVDSLDIGALLDLELQKSQPDTFLVSQIGRTLRLHEPAVALQLCTTLLSSANLHAFRASWSTIMRGIAAVRADTTFGAIFEGLDNLLDAIPHHSSHLLQAETNCLHYLRTLRFAHTDARGEYVLRAYSSWRSQTVSTTASRSV